jgi:hypothetical protein
VYQISVPLLPLSISTARPMASYTIEVLFAASILPYASQV